MNVEFYEAMDEERLKAMKKALRQHLTRLDTAVKKKIQDNTITPVEIDAYSIDISASRERHQTVCQLFLQHVETDALENEVRQIADYDDRALENLAALHRLKAPPDEAEIPQVPPVGTHVRLPRLELPRFNGAPTQWNAFWEAFSESVHLNPSLTDGERFRYLKTHLSGTALSAIDGLQVTSELYQTAIDILNARFGNKDSLMLEHFRRLMFLGAHCKGNDSKSLRNLVDTVSLNTRALEALGSPRTSFVKTTVEAMLQCLSYQLRTEVHRYLLRKADDVQPEGGNNLAKDDLSHLLEYLETEIDCLDRAKRSEPIDQKAPKTQARNEQTHGASGRHGKKTTPSTFALYSAESKSTMAKNTGCYFCQKNHDTSCCTAHMNADERREILRKEHRCFRCTMAGHMARGCATKITCKRCGGRHATAMCESRSRSSAVIPSRPIACDKVDAPSASVSALSNTPSSGTNHILLQTAQVYALGTKGEAHVRILFDGGSQLSYVNQELVEFLKPKCIGKQQLAISAFMSSHEVKTLDKVILKLKACYGNQEVHEIVALVVPTLICDSNLPFVSEKNRQQVALMNVQLADLPPVNRGTPKRISVLIGQDNLGRLSKPQIQCVPETTLQVTETVFGWTVQGPEREQYSNVQTACMAVHTSSSDDLQTTLSDFWNLESIGIFDDKIPDYNDSAGQQLRSGIARLADGRYEVPLIWNEVKTAPLHSNKDVAEGRLRSLTRRLVKTNTGEAYHSEIMKNFEQGFSELALDDQAESLNEPVYYMPHQAVIREESLTTRVRIVFDASSSDKGCESLNDQLLGGPNLNPDLMYLLLNFRTYRIGMIGDIEKAFLQISLQPSQRNAVRYLWYEQPPTRENPLPVVRTFRMCRVPFGVSCSPFLLAGTIRCHLEQSNEIDRKFADLISDSTYVDDIVIGADTLGEARELYKNIRHIFAQAKMNVTKWASNSREVTAFFEDERTNAPPKAASCCSCSMFKVLGVCWDQHTDFFTFNFKHILELPAATTKRTVLEITARLYDPLGLFLPFSVRAKLILQQLWKLDLNWDSQIPSDIMSSFHEWCYELDILSAIKIPRYLHADLTAPLSCALHVFGDASPLAYGAVVYLRTTDAYGYNSVKLLCSKSRVAPLKTHTLPRLELMAAVIASRLVKNVELHLKLTIQAVRLWTDSKITLAWIKGEAHLRKPFVCNRIQEIQQITSGDQWKYCSGKNNPADLLSRGIKAEALSTMDLWWNGPDWLALPENEWPGQEEETNGLIPVEEEDRKSHTLIVGSRQEAVIPLDRFSRLDVLLRVVAYALRFVNRLRGIGEHPTTTVVSTEEIEAAELVCIRQAQQVYFGSDYKSLVKNARVEKDSSIFSLLPYLDQAGCMRLKGRIGELNVPVDVKHPYILPTKSNFTNLVIRDTHRKMKHSGVTSTLAEVRQKYWIVKGRQAVTMVIRRCVTCDRFRSRAASQLEAALPPQRVNQALPFEYTGVDFAGPLITKNRKKVYIALYTCALSRAVHLELVNGQTTAHFLMSFQRFVSRRGQCRYIISDNAATFVRASKDLKLLWDHLSSAAVQTHFANWRICWKFNTPRAPWHGGFFERMVRTVKSMLKKTLGLTSLGFEELTTLLSEIEAVINSRPITYTYDSADEPVALSASHLLIGRRPNELPSSKYKLDESLLSSTSQQLQRRYVYRQKLLDAYWKRWLKEYLLELRSAHHTRSTTQPNLFVGQVVLLYEDGLAKHLWTLARIEEVFFGRDGLVRSCLVKVPGGSIYRRPIQLLYPLESVQNEADEKE